MLIYVLSAIAMQYLGKTWFFMNGFSGIIKSVVDKSCCYIFASKRRLIYADGASYFCIIPTNHCVSGNPLHLAELPESKALSKLSELSFPMLNNFVVASAYENAFSYTGIMMCMRMFWVSSELWVCVLQSLENKASFKHKVYTTCRTL